MKKESSLKQNFIYNIVYQILILILPLITVPYVSRVLGVENIGIYSYTYSIISYFMLIGLLGINNYGSRTIAKCRDDKEKLSKNFLGIYCIQFVMSFLMIIIYTFFIAYVREYKTIFTIQIIYLISTLFDINWLFFGLEKFKITVTRNIFIKLISLVMVFLLVKTEEDLWKYTLIMALSTLLGQLVLFKFLKNEIVFTKIKFIDIKKHFKQCFVLFIPVIAVSLYKIMDKTMIGLMAGVEEVGYYEQAEKIVNIPMGIITALGTVMLPRISNLISNGKDKKISEYLEKSINFMMFLAFPICLGIIAVSGDFIPLFLGNEFEKSSIILNYLSITLIFISFANIIRTQYLIPKERDKEYIISVILGAIINFIMNMIFIPKFASIGACFGTIAAEFVVMLYQITAINKEIKIFKYISNVKSFFIKAIIMFLIVYIIKLIDFNSIVKVSIQVIVGGVIYSILNYKYINSLVNLKEIKQKLWSIIWKERKI